MDPNRMIDLLRERMERAGFGKPWHAVNDPVVWPNGDHTHTITTSPHRECTLARVETLSTAHRLLSSLAEQTSSRAELDECREVMAALERMVSDA